MWKRLDRKLSASKKHPRISDFAFRVWTHVLPWGDVRGVYPRDPVLVKNVCMPRYDYRLEQIDSALQELYRERLVHLFDCGEDVYLVLHDHDEWNPMTRMRNQRPEWPAPPRGLCESPSCSAGPPPSGSPSAAKSVSSVSSSSVARDGPKDWLTSCERRAYDVVTSCRVGRGGVGGREPGDLGAMVDGMTPAQARATIAMASRMNTVFPPEVEATLRECAGRHR